MNKLRPINVLFFWFCCIATPVFFVFFGSYALLLPIFGMTPYLASNFYEGRLGYMVVIVNCCACIAAIFLCFWGVSYALLLPIIWILLHWLYMFYLARPTGMLQFASIVIKDKKCKLNNKNTTKTLCEKLKRIKLHATIASLPPGNDTLILKFSHQMSEPVYIAMHDQELPRLCLSSFLGESDLGDISHYFISKVEENGNIDLRRITLLPFVETILQKEIPASIQLKKAKSLILTFHESIIEIGDYACHVSELQWHCKIEAKQALDVSRNEERKQR